MKNFREQYKTENTSKEVKNFWLSLLQRLRLLVLSLTRMRDHLSGIFFHDLGDSEKKNLIEKPITTKQNIINNKITIMKSNSRLIKWGIMLLLTIVSLDAMGQVPYQNSGNHNVCLNSTEPYGVPLTSGSNYNWSITPTSGGNGTITYGVTRNLITVNWTSVGDATLTVIETNSNGCDGVPVSITVTVKPTNTISLTSASITTVQTVCINTAITNITYATTGATGATFSGLPAGVTGTWVANVVTISGSPSTVTGSPFMYKVTLTSDCSNVTSTGTITVNLLPTTTPITHN